MSASCTSRCSEARPYIRKLEAARYFNFSSDVRRALISCSIARPSSPGYRTFVASALTLKPVSCVKAWVAIAMLLRNSLTSGLRFFITSFTSSTPAVSWAPRAYRSSFLTSMPAVMRMQEAIMSARGFGSASSPALGANIFSRAAVTLSAAARFSWTYRSPLVRSL